jgi:hypothetical protein
MKHLYLLLITSILSIINISANNNDKQEYYEIKLYHISTSEQENRIDNYLKNSYIPALHKAGIKNIGVFKPIENDSVNFGKLIYVFIPFKSVEQYLELPNIINADSEYQKNATEYLNASYNNSPYDRIETTFLKAFKNMPIMNVPKLNAKKSEHIYELRSYESATESLLDRKIHMFNEGGEIPLFDSLNFNAVFYAKVLVGNKMPNLMYMTSFDNMATRDEHWKSFFSSKKWEELIANDYYNNSVSKAVISLLSAAEYSDI